MSETDFVLFDSENQYIGESIKKGLNDYIACAFRGGRNMEGGKVKISVELVKPNDATLWGVSYVVYPQPLMKRRPE